MKRLVGNTPEEKFNSAVNKAAGLGPHGKCWEWVGSRTTHGYGETYDEGRKVKAHRLAWKMANGREPELHILHSCDNPPCVNPAHLREGTHLENMRDRDMRGRLDVHPSLGEANGSSKLTVAEVLAIRAETASGEPQRRVGERYGVSRITVGLIHRRQAWGHI